MWGGWDDEIRRRHAFNSGLRVLTETKRCGSGDTPQPMTTQTPPPAEKLLDALTRKHRRWALPILRAVEELGEQPKARDVCARIHNVYREQFRDRTWKWIEDTRRIAWTRLHLVHCKLLSGDSRGVWALTDLGRQALRECANEAVDLLQERPYRSSDFGGSSCVCQGSHPTLCLTSTVHCPSSMLLSSPSVDLLSPSSSPRATVLAVARSSNWSSTPSTPPLSPRDTCTKCSRT